MSDSTNVERDAQQPHGAGPYVPHWLRLGGAWGWRFAALSAALYVVLRVCVELWVAVLPVLLGGIIASLLAPLAKLLRKLKIPRSIAGALSVLLSIALVVGGLFLFGYGVAQELDKLSQAASDGYKELLTWSADLFGVSEEAARGYVDQRISDVQSHAGAMAKQVLTQARSVAEGLTVLVVMLVFAWFFTWDGDRQFEHVVCILPPGQRHHARALGARVWDTVGGYMRGMLVIATADALLLGLGLWLIGLPLVFPLMLLMFMGAFVPFAGPLITGLMAVLVAMGNGGLTTVGLVLLVTVAVQQIEGNLLHPFIMGRAVELHPAMILFALTAGGVLAGVIGVFLAIPVAASLATIFSYVREQSDDSGPEESSATASP